MKDEVTVITGAGKGIGREIAHGFAEHGATVAICARTHQDIKKVENEIKERGGKVLAFVCDVKMKKRLKDS